MNEFFEVFSLVLLALFIVNLITSIYPLTQNKHTLMIVFSVISVYVCITPITTLLNAVRNMESFSIEAVLEDFEEDSKDKTYTDELKSILERQIEAEIDGKFEGINSKVVLGISGQRSDTENYQSGAESTVNTSEGSDENTKSGAENAGNDTASSAGEIDTSNKTSQKSTGENERNSGNGTLEIVEIAVSGDGEGRGAEISEYIKEKYGIEPIITENTQN